MKPLKYILPLLLACAALGQNVDTLPAILGSAVDKANDKLLIRDASVAAGAGALRSLELDELVNVPGLFSSLAIGVAQISGLGSAATTAATAYTPARIPGVFASDLAAIRGGVGLNGIYRKAAGVIAWRQPVAEKLALMGDSIAAQNSVGNYYMDATGYGTWARIFGGAQWDAEPSGAVLYFATGGFRTYEIEATHLPQVLASGATRCVVEGGINDYSVGQTSAQTASRLRGMWATLQAAGITPIATTITPDVFTVPRQAWIAATNILIRQHAASDNVALCDWTGLLALSPGVGDPQYYKTGDYVHPNESGACRMGRALAATIASIGLDPFDNYANTQWISANSALAGSGGQPTSWSAPAMAAGAALVSKTLTSSVEGNWWQIEFTNGSATAVSVLSNIAASLEAPAGLTVDGVVELAVISGTLTHTQFRAIAQGGTQTAADGYEPVPNPSARITSADGVVVFRTPKTLMSGAVTMAWPQLSFMGGSGTTIFRIRRCGVRKY
jgi:lysophospholipase L1-like esterase